MFSVVGVDVSSQAIDLVALDENSDRAEWTHLPLTGKTPFERCLQVGEVMPHPAWYIEQSVYLVAIERPRSRFFKSLSAQLPVFGAVAANVADTMPDLDVWELAPVEWRKVLGMAGTASKETVYEWALERWVGQPLHELARQDAWDAFCVAYAARELNEKAIAKRGAA